LRNLVKTDVASKSAEEASSVDRNATIEDSVIKVLANERKELRPGSNREQLRKSKMQQMSWFTALYSVNLWMVVGSPLTGLFKEIVAGQPFWI
jgi:hypothetical protein